MLTSAVCDAPRAVTIVSRTCLIAGDLTVLIVTWVNTYTVSRVKLGMRAGPSILHVMLYNGAYAPTSLEPRTDLERRVLLLHVSLSLGVSS